jgi:hypothetical protein
MRPVALLLALAAPAAAQDITSARLTHPTDRYDHGVLGDALEWGGLEMTLKDGRRLQVTLPEDRVFEDTTARLGDFDGDGRPEVMVVETRIDRGASLAIYDARGERAATQPIGRTHRWLAPAGWGDFDGDGRVEIAYVDRPHLARELVFLRLSRKTLTEIARAPGLTNHRIGMDNIPGQTRRCAGYDSLILASADWSRMIEASLTPDSRVVTRDLGPLASAAALSKPRPCP